MASIEITPDSLIVHVEGAARFSPFQLDQGGNQPTVPPPPD